jgi:acyl-CoA dehydrogenase
MYKTMYKKIFQFSKKLVPKISETESIALNSGTKSVEKYFFQGKIQNNYLKNTYKYPSLSSTSILHTHVEKLCSKVNDYEIFQSRKVNDELVNHIKKDKLFGMIIPKQYDGLELNHHEQSQIVQKISTASNPLGVMVMVPNSLGPAELLLKYGTEEEKNKYLKGLSNGAYIPCFGLTGQYSGSDAASMLDSGELFEKDNKKFIRLNISKRYITLAPISNLVGIAFKLNDPNKLLTTGKEGITLALLEPSKYNLEIGNKHNPLDVPFPNGTIKANNLEIPIESLIGGEKNAGNGWKMLMECLAVGRSISLPACAVGSAKLTTNYVGAYSVYRTQFKTILANMEGVQDKLSKIATETLKITSIQYLTNAILDNQEKPSVISAIMKYETTERARDIVNNGMDIVAGAGICKGPRNLLGNVYQAIPIGITVEGSNTLTKNLIIFGQGLMKSHPYLYNLVQSIEQDNLQDFKKNLNGMIVHSIKTTTIGFYYVCISNLLFTSQCQNLIEEKYINNFALTSNLVLLMGKKFKTNELTSGKMAEVLGSLYILHALDWFNQNNEYQLTDLVKHAKYEEYNKIQKNLKHISDNFPIQGIKQILQIINSESYCERNFKITDNMIKKSSDCITKNKQIREILSENIYQTPRLKIMNDNLMSILHYNERKDKTFKNYELEELIDEITKVDEFENKK